MVTNNCSIFHILLRSSKTLFNHTNASCYKVDQNNGVNIIRGNCCFKAELLRNESYHKTRVKKKHIKHPEKKNKGARE